MQVQFLPYYGMYCVLCTLLDAVQTTSVLYRSGNRTRNRTRTRTVRVRVGKRANEARVQYESGPNRWKITGYKLKNNRL
jgi:hypothetical protein